jgi:RNA polymerase sigma-70 factor (ECF subfamily)
MAHAQQAASGTDLSRYHIEVGIAWEHCRAQDFATTDWSRIAQLYSLLQDGYSTPMIRLNAAVATSYVAGPDAGRDLLLKMEGAERKRLRPWWDCCMAQLNERRSDPQAALSHWRDALALATAEPQRQLIQNQIDRLIAR